MARGEKLVFDDSHPHEVWNDSDSQRVVLFVDVMRPLFFPLSLLNRLMIRIIARFPSVTELMNDAQEVWSRRSESGWKSGTNEPREQCIWLATGRKPSSTVVFLMTLPTPH